MAEKPWREKALEEQQLLYEMFGGIDWDCYKDVDAEFLERNVGHAMFGLPEEMPETKNRQTGYSAKQLEQIRKVCDAIKKHSKLPSGLGENSVWMSVVFVCLDLDVSVPVFRIPHYVHESDRESCQFLDTNCRVYKDWGDFLNNRQDLACSSCWPVNGVYTADDQGRVLVEFGETPACRASNRICSTLDVASKYITIGGMAVGAAGLICTVGAPVAAAAAAGSAVTGLYSSARSVATLVDRGKHKQSVGIRDSESLHCWVAILGNSFGMASAKAIQRATKMAESGKVLSKGGRFLVNALNVGSLTVNGLGVYSHLVSLQDKHREGNLTRLDKFQFASALLFFTMSAEPPAQ